MKNICAIILLALATLSAEAQSNGYYRLKNKATGEYATMACDALSYDKALYDIGASGMLKDSGKETAVNKVGCYLQHDIRMTSTPNTVPGSVFYIKSQSTKDKTFNLFGEGTSIYKITTGVYTGSSTFGNLNVGGFYTYVKTVSGSSGLYTMYVNPKMSVKLIIVTKTVDMGNNYFKATGSTFGIEKDAASKDYAQWYLEPATTFNVAPLSKVKEPNGHYWTTLCVDFPFSVPASGTTVLGVYTVKGKTSDGYAVLEPLTGTIAGGTPVLIECSTDNSETNILNIETATEPAGKSCANGEVLSTSGNYLQGRYFNAPSASYSYLNTYKSPNVTEQLSCEQNVLTNNQTNYRVLNCVNGQVGFYKLKNAKTTMGANKAFLNISGLPTVEPTAGAKVFGMEDFDTTTGISSAAADERPAVIYDLQGRRVVKPTKHGMYIVNGRKVVF